MDPNHPLAPLVQRLSPSLRCAGNAFYSNPSTVVDTYRRSRDRARYLVLGGFTGGMGAGTSDSDILELFGCQYLEQAVVLEPVVAFLKGRLALDVLYSWLNKEGGAWVPVACYLQETLDPGAKLFVPAH